MPLSGEAKKEYQRKYMRRRRAGEKKAAAPSIDRPTMTKPNTGDGTARIRQLEAELARERARREAAEAGASPTTERSAQLEAMLRKYSMKIDALQVQNKRIATAQGGMRVDEYNKILKVLHPDRRPSDAEKNEAFRLFTKSMKPFVLKDDDMTTITTPTPRTREDLKALKRYAEAQRMARRAAARLFKKKT
jgi:tellurite resistance protein